MNKQNNEATLFEWLCSPKRYLKLILPLTMAVVLSIGALTATDFSIYAKLGVVLGSLSWAGLFVLQQYLVLRKLRKSRNKTAV